MKILRIRGGIPLVGEAEVSGAKNAALPILAATLLVRAPIELSGVPEIGDTAEMLTLLSMRGVLVRRIGKGRYLLDASDAEASDLVIPGDGRLRGSLYLLGAGLAAFGRSSVGVPGGCQLGERPFDLHLLALRALGAVAFESEGRLFAKAESLHGAEIRLAYPSVGATVNAILAALGAKGRSVIYGAAREPHIVDLIRFLISCGASIRIGADGEIVVFGGERLSGTDYRIMPDMIEAGSYLLMAASTRGDLLLRRAPLGQLGALFPLLRETGCELTPLGDDLIRLRMRSRPRPISVQTEPYPGFPTDLHPPLAAYLSLGSGESRITETVFKDRFRYREGLSAFGAHLSLADKTACIQGRDRLCGARVSAPDLRAAAAYLTAALAAEGESILCHAELLYRGYETPLFKLRRLGAVISDGDALSV